MINLSPNFLNFPKSIGLNPSFNWNFFSNSIWSFLWIDNKRGPLVWGSYRIFFNLKYRFRNYKQYYSYSLVWHKAINNQSLILKENNDLLEIHRPHKIGSKSVISLLDKNELDNSVFALNIQSLDLVNANDLNIILNWLKTKTKINLKWWFFLMPYMR